MTNTAETDTPIFEQLCAELRDGATSAPTATPASPQRPTASPPAR